MPSAPYSAYTLFRLSRTPSTPGQSMMAGRCIDIDSRFSTIDFLYWHKAMVSLNCKILQLLSGYLYSILF
jgi:hypothetical protein